MFKVLTGQINTFLISIAIAATSLGIYFHTLPAYHAHTINDNVQIVVTKEMDCLAYERRIAPDARATCRSTLR